MTPDEDRGGKFVAGFGGGLLFWPRASPILTVFLQQGKLYVRGDSKIFRFQNGKSESLFLQRKNPRRIAWTVLYRRQHRKGISEVRFLRSRARPNPRWERVEGKR
jgi:ribosomal protein L24E